MATGGLSATISGIIMMPVLYVENLVSQHMVLYIDMSFVL